MLFVQVLNLHHVLHIFLFFPDYGILALTGVKRSRMAYVDKQPSVRVIYSSLTRSVRKQSILILKCISSCVVHIVTLKFCMMLFPDAEIL